MRAERFDLDAKLVVLDPQGLPVVTRLDREGPLLVKPLDFVTVAMFGDGESLANAFDLASKSPGLLIHRVTTCGGRRLKLVELIEDVLEMEAQEPSSGAGDRDFMVALLELLCEKIAIGAASDQFRLPPDQLSGRPLACGPLLPQQPVGFAQTVDLVPERVPFLRDASNVLRARPLQDECECGQGGLRPG